MKLLFTFAIFVLLSSAWALPALNELQGEQAFGSKPTAAKLAAPTTAKPLAPVPVPVATSPPPTQRPFNSPFEGVKNSAITSPPTNPVPTPPPQAVLVTVVDDKVFLPKKDALPNIKGWTEFKGRSGSLDWRIGNIIPRAMDASVGFKAWSENGVPKIRITMSDSNTQLSAKENVRSLVETARLVDMSIDYFIKGNSWVSGKLIDSFGTTDIVILMKVGSAASVPVLRIGSAAGSKPVPSPMGSAVCYACGGQSSVSAMAGRRDHLVRCENAIVEARQGRDLVQARRQHRLRLAVVHL
jgi:hypothetical protein